MLAMQRKQRSFRAIYEAQLFRPPKEASGRKVRTFPMMARALRALPEVWLKEDAKHVWVLSDLHLATTTSSLTATDPSVM